jgi:hypothetical protein
MNQGYQQTSSLAELLPDRAFNLVLAIHSFGLTFIKARAVSPIPYVQGDDAYS